VFDLAAKLSFQTSASRVRLRFVAIFVGALSLYLTSSRFSQIFHPTLIDNYVVLADAWLHGHIWVAHSELPAVDGVMYGGNYYVIEGPMPAVLMLPLVAMFGLSANQSLVCVLAASVGVAACDLVLGRMNLEPKLRVWLVVFLGFGTVLWWCTLNPAVWMCAHVVCVMFLTLTLAEWYGRRRYWLVGFLFACAALTRFPTILAVLPFLYWTWADAEDRAASVRSFLVGLAPLLVLQVLYDLARWHTPLDIGYTLFYHKDPAGSPTGYPFSLGHLPFNLYSMFFLAPAYINSFPWLKPTYQGVALTFTSPALVLALCAGKSKESTLLWLSVVLVALPDLLYYVNGFSQFGMRHSLDFTPFLLCLAARGFSRRPDPLGFWLIGYSVVANAFGVWSRVP